MTVVSEVPVETLIPDPVMTNRADITRITVEGIMLGWNRVVLHHPTLHSRIFRRIHKK